MKKQIVPRVRIWIDFDFFNILWDSQRELNEHFLSFFHRELHFVVKNNQKILKTSQQEISKWQTFGHDFD